MFYSEYTAEGRRITKLDQILLNGNNIAIVRNLDQILVMNGLVKVRCDLLCLTLFHLLFGLYSWFLVVLPQMWHKQALP